MDQKRKLGELISMNTERPNIIHIFEEEEVTIGKSQQNTNCIDDNRIANFHCSIFYQDGQIVLKNLTTQGTFINKEKMGLYLEVNLEHGDHIHLLCQKGKKVTEKDVIAYVLFKYENKKQSAKKSSKSKQPIFEQIGDNLICIICQEIYFEGVTVSPCGHVFCGFCLEGWQAEKNTCPICRVKMTNVTKAFQINKIVDTLLELNPEIEQKQKPANKYFHQDENESESESYSDRELELANEVLDSLFQGNDIQIYQQQNRFRQNILQWFNDFSRLHLEEVLQPENEVDHPPNIQQNEQQNIRQNAQQDQQNEQAQNGQAQNGQAQNGQTN